MKQRLSRNNAMKPGCLIWMTDNISFQVPEIPAGLIKKSVSVPRGRMEIPEVRNYKEQDPKKKECCFWFNYRPKTGCQATRVWQEGAKQKEHAEQPADRLPWVAPNSFTIMRHAGKHTNQQSDKRQAK